MSAQRYKGRMLDPAVVRDYANFILKKKENIENSVSRLNQYSAWMDEDWRDMQNHVFRERFIPHMQNMRKLSELLEQYAAFCNKMAGMVETYNMD